MENLKIAQKINEGVRSQDVRFCLLCRSEGVLFYNNLRDRLFGAPGKWSLIRCTKCGLVWLNPRPISDDLIKLYMSYFTHDLNQSPTKCSPIKRLIRDAILAFHLGYVELEKNKLQRIFGRFLTLIGPIREMVELSVSTLNGEQRGKLLDVGCGSGAFLKKIKDLGWDVLGVEPDADAVKVARDRFGLKIINSTLEEANFYKNMFDAITMNHVIEHVPNPIDIFKECRRVLKPNGKLVVITPNAESLGAWLFKKNWLHWDPPRHLHIFSLRTLQECAEQAGLKIVNHYTTARSACSMCAASHLIRKNGVLPVGSPQKNNFYLSFLGLALQVIEYGFCKMKEVGEEIVLIATK